MNAVNQGIRKSGVYIEKQVNWLYVDLKGLYSLEVWGGGCGGRMGAQRNSEIWFTKVNGGTGIGTRKNSPSAGEWKHACFSEGTGTCQGLGACPRSYVSLEVRCLCGRVAPLLSPDLRCLPVRLEKPSAGAGAFINSMWQQSTAALGPALLQAGFHNPSNMPDLPARGQEVMHSRSLPTLGAAYWLRVGMFKISTVWLWQGTSGHDHQINVIFCVYKKNSSRSLKKPELL